MRSHIHNDRHPHGEPANSSELPHSVLTELEAELHPGVAGEVNKFNWAIDQALGTYE